MDHRRLQASPLLIDLLRQMDANYSSMLSELRSIQHTLSAWSKRSVDAQAMSDVDSSLVTKSEFDTLQENECKVVSPITSEMDSSLDDGKLEEDGPSEQDTSSKLSLISSAVHTAKLMVLDGTLVPSTTPLHFGENRVISLAHKMFDLCSHGHTLAEEVFSAKLISWDDYSKILRKSENHIANNFPIQCVLTRFPFDPGVNQPFVENFRQTSIQWQKLVVYQVFDEIALRTGNHTVIVLDGFIRRIAMKCASQLFDEASIGECFDVIHAPHQNIVWIQHALSFHSWVDTGQTAFAHLPWDCTGHTGTHSGGMDRAFSIMEKSDFASIKADGILASRHLAESSRSSFPFDPDAPMYMATPHYTELVFFDMSKSLKLVTWDIMNSHRAPSTQKRAHVVWSIKLHRMFVASVNQLCIDKEVSIQTLDLINIKRFIMQNVASYLQMHRLHSRRISTIKIQQDNFIAVEFYISGKFGATITLADSREVLGESLCHYFDTTFTTWLFLTHFHFDSRENPLISIYCGPLVIDVWDTGIKSMTWSRAAGLLEYVTSNSLTKVVLSFASSPVDYILLDILSAISYMESWSLNVGESALSLKKLHEFRVQLQEHQFKNSARVHSILEFVRTIQDLCAILGMNFSITITKVYSRVSGFYGVKSNPIAAKQDWKEKSIAAPMSILINHLMCFPCKDEALQLDGAIRNISAIVYEFCFYQKLGDCSYILGLHLVVDLQMNCYKRVTKGHAWWLFLREVLALALKYGGDFSNFGDPKILAAYLKSVWLLGLRGLQNSKTFYFMKLLLQMLLHASILGNNFLRVEHKYKILTKEHKALQCSTYTFRELSAKELLHHKDMYNTWIHGSLCWAGLILWLEVPDHFSFLELNLEDKVLIEDGGNVMNYSWANLGKQTPIGLKRSNWTTMPSQRLIWDPGPIRNLLNTTMSWQEGIIENVLCLRQSLFLLSQILLYPLTSISLSFILLSISISSFSFQFEYHLCL